MYVSDAPSAPMFDNIIAFTCAENLSRPRLYAPLQRRPTMAPKPTTVEQCASIPLTKTSSKASKNRPGTLHHALTRCVPNCRHTACKSPIITSRIE